MIGQEKSIKKVTLEVPLFRRQKEHGFSFFLNAFYF
jgi:hypothetical protein